MHGFELAGASSNLISGIGNAGASRELPLE
jgi:hypothetical protein